MKKVYVNYKGYKGVPKGSSNQPREGVSPFIVNDDTPSSKVHKRAKNLARTEIARLFSTSEKEIVIQRYSLEIDMD